MELNIEYTVLSQIALCEGGDVFRCCSFFFFQAEDGIRDLVRSRGLGDVYKRQGLDARPATAT